MRFVTILLFAAGIGLGAGCGRNEAAGAPGSEVLVRSHFAGLTQLAGNPDATKLKEALALPETQALREQTLGRLAQAPRVLSGQALPAEQIERGAALLRPLLDDLLDRESALEVRGPVGRTEWMLAVALNPERLAIWDKNLTALMALWNLPSPQVRTNGGLRVTEFKRAASPEVIRWVDAGSWLVLGVGSATLPASDAAVQRLKTGGRPVSVLTNALLEAEADLGQLQRPLGLPAQLPWPRARISTGAKGENLRVTMNLTFAEPVTGPLAPWHVPTNLIQEPLISFTAMRGVAPWLQRSETLAQLGVKPVPNEFYFWAQQALVFQSFFAFPAADPTNTVERLGQRGSGVLGAGWKERGFSTIEWQPASSSALWKDLPYITPFARPASDAGSGFVVGGLFPPMVATTGLPRELLAQVTGRNDLVYYDWEITQERLAQWRTTSQLFAMLADRSQFTSNMVSFRWLTAVERHLGNTTTEITASSPKEWSLARKSHVGFTGVELVGLARWLESTNFPHLGLELPRALPGVAPKPATPGAKPKR
jgi:hypothetical protein